jgi:hypothetical protein
MANSKKQESKSKTKRVDDDEEQMKSRDEPADEEAVDVEAEDADKEATELDVDDDEAEPETDAEAEADDAEPPKDDKDEESVDEGPVAPPAKTSKTVIVLILVNWIAAPMFLVFAYMDNMVRVQYSYRTMLNYVQVWGLPLKSEEQRHPDTGRRLDADSLSNQTRPLIVLTPDQLKAEFNKRPGVKRTNEQFAPFEETLEKRIPFQLRPSDMSPDLLRDVFQGQPDKAVATLDEEIDRLKTSLPSKIEEAAEEVKQTLAKKTDVDKRAIVKKALSPFSWDSAQAKKLETKLDETKGAELDAEVKRTVIRNLLFTFAWDVWQVKHLDDGLKKAKGADLDGILDDAVQRRIYYDILAPINVFRPGEIKDAKNYKIEKLSDLKAYPLDEVKKFMQERLDASIADKYNPDVHMGDYWSKENPSPEAMTRDSIEKRQKIAFIMFTLSQVTVPTLEKKPLFPKGIERAQIVCGLYEFTTASIHYVRALRVLEERITYSVAGDRQGHSHLLVELLKLTPEELIKRFDKDGDGKLSRDEFGASLPKAFAAADKDGDGKLDREEVAVLQAMLKKNQETTRTDGFIDEYEDEIDRLVKIVEHIDGAQKRRADLKLQRDHFQKIYDQRAEQFKLVKNQLLAARKTTEKYAKDLRELQDQLHAALVDLSEAADRNFRLEEEIRAIELGYPSQQNKKGVKQP